MNDKLRDTIILNASHEVGYIEKNGNDTIYGNWFGLNFVAWCGIFVSYVYFKSGYPIKSVGYLKGFAGCQSMYDYALKSKLITNQPQRGDIVLFDWNNDKRYDHVGIFVKELGNGIIETIEGNTALKNDSNGGSVMVRQRKIENCIFINLIK